LRLSAVVLAAGKSERMGVNKLLLRIAGRTLLDHILEALEAAGLREVYVVLGHRPEMLRPVLERHDVEEVLNPEYEEGMLSSFKAGLRRVSSEAAYLVLGDQLLEPALLVKMASAMEGDPQAEIVSPTYLGRRGHPVLFRSSLFGEILSLRGGETLRDLIERHSSSHRLVEGGPLCVLDIDTPEDFERARRLYEALLSSP
jgi:molybdenum cofactor cytidylyltransferase